VATDDATWPTGVVSRGPLDERRAPEVEQDEIRAAGGVLTRRAGDVVEVLVVHRSRYDDWSLPKGKADDGEPDEEAARREVEEETGVRPRLGEELSTVRYRDRKDRPKRVRYWHMTVDHDRPFVPSSEVDEVRWLPLAEAGTLLSYPHDRALLAELDPDLPGASGPTRHAKERPE
jgi:8-oxo-dGTP diphosphatase